MQVAAEHLAVGHTCMNLSEEFSAKFLVIPRAVVQLKNSALRAVGIWKVEDF